jgi:hypothetical protein
METIKVENTENGGVNCELNNIYILIKTIIDSENNYCRNSFDFTLNFISYNQLYLELKDIVTKNKNKKFVTFCSDPSISASIIPVFNELESSIEVKPNDKLNYEYPEFTSRLKIIKFTSNLHFNYKNSITKLIEPDNDIRHRMILKPEQFIFMGLDSNNSDIVNGTTTYSKNDLHTNLEKILKLIKLNIDSEPVFIDIDLSIFDQILSPLCLRHPEELKNPDLCINIKNSELKLILKYLSELNVCGINISGFCVDFNDVTMINRIQIETIQQIYGTILKLKEKKINIYNEHSRFLIFKPKQEIINDYDDIGWYIMRNVDSELKDRLLEDIKDGEIIQIQIEDDENIKQDVLISVTTLADQDELSYYLADDYSDKRLYPDEKLDSYFNLVA